MDVKAFEAYLKLAKKHGVSKFSVDGCSVHFLDQPATLSKQDAKDVLGSVEGQLPPDLRTDAVNSADQVLMWSAGNTYDAHMPLTGDGELNGIPV